jgi:uncharacterized protein
MDPMTDPFQINRLGDETSPYLQQHKDNPVHWQAWSQEALDYAKAHDKPILLSVGYAACHWCHVMAHESFENPETAALMNAHFVNIKVDREERPDIDTIYMNALAFLGQPTGWPLTMFLDPEGKPFYGGTYFPPEANYGRPAFRDMLNRIVEVYRNDKNAIAQNSLGLIQRLDKLAGQATSGTILPAALRAVADSALLHLDRHNGGVGNAPKFPQLHIFDLLWRAYLKTGDKTYYNAVTRTLDHVCQGGIYDHLGGGFARYTVDARWLVPHFEKMLYDNGQFVSLLTKVWQETRSPLYEARIRETIAWLLREMVTGAGAFGASLDADSEGEEGKFYVWSDAEIRGLLGKDADLFCDVYDVTPTGNWDGKNILNRLNSKDKRLSPENEAALRRSREILLKARAKRVRPGWDDKVLADWNGLMIAGLAEAGAAFDETDWLGAAQTAFNTIATKLAVPGAPERLYHSYRFGEARHTALLDDYASMGAAAIALHDATGEADYLDWARAWMETLEAHYADAERGAYFYTADDAEALITRTRNAVDTAAPSGNGLAVSVLAALYHLTGEPILADRAEKAATAFAGDLERGTTAYSTLVSAYDALHRAVDIVVVGARGEAETDALIRAVRQVSLPAHTLQVVGPGAKLPANHPAAGKAAGAKTGTAFVCAENRCSLAITEPDELAATLISARAGRDLVTTGDSASAAKS